MRPPRPAGSSPIATQLLREPFLQLQLLTSACVGALYVLPVVSPAILQEFALKWLCVPFMIWPLVGCLAGLRSVPATERAAWLLLAQALAWWLAALVAFGAIPLAVWSPIADAAIATLYLGFYVCVLLAIERKPHLTGGLRESRLEQGLRALGVAVFTGGWTVYAVVLPGVWAGDFNTEPVLDSLAFVLLDGVVIARLALAWLEARTTRWRHIYGALLLASLVLLATDLANVLVARAWVEWPAGQLTDLLWGLPGLAYLAAIRLRHCEFPQGRAEATSEALPDEPGPAGLGIFLMIGALSFPLLHVVLQAWDVVPPVGRPTGIQALVVVIASALLMSALAVLAYRALERQRQRMQLEQRLLQAQLLQSQKMEAVGRLAGGVAHDFNNLLTAINGNNDLALDMIATGEVEPLKEVLGEVTAATRRAASLTGQLLSFSRRQIVMAQEVDLNSAVVGLERMLRRLIGEDVRLETHLDAAAPHALVDRGQLDQVVLNLAINARDAMPTGGTITIATAGIVADGRSEPGGAGLRPGAYARISVSDTGGGIAEDVLPNIFEPFFTTKAHDKGTGLGLATVYGVAKQAGGGVTVETKSGRGSRFEVYLPAVGIPAAPSGTSTAAPAVRGGTEAVLLVEDDVAVRRLARRSLEQRGYRVVEAVSARHALELAATHPDGIDLLLTDVVMPDLNGREVADAVRAMRPDVTVLFMSGYADDASVHQGVLAERLHFLTKPFTSRALAAKVRSVLDEGGARLTASPVGSKGPANRPDSSARSGGSPTITDA